ncbi:hypothetical protein Lalb_Chr02g0152251 [Lupinus albus]|uniref:Uncharacterized protein n=1 Tax=Lupinus albus TaxID=3870 RepID=A0A6A4QWX0_LUPAL|nr:hypothetical protein Lalb_Chr02g0152251 [Lupinus albus]
MPTKSICFRLFANGCYQMQSISFGSSSISQKNHSMFQKQYIPEDNQTFLSYLHSEPELILMLLLILIL